MRFLADENMPRLVVNALRAAGQDVAWVRSEAPGIDDATVLAMALEEQRILLSFDTDFGELAARSPLTDSCGVILLRLPMDRHPDTGSRIAALILARSDWAGHFSVIDRNRTRMRRLIEDQTRRP